MRLLRRNAGQFVPMSAMIMFTMVMFLVAIVNIYKVSKAKLKVQNLADAAALNLASQQAQAYNVVTFKNEWLNTMLQGTPSTSDGGLPDCSIFNMNTPSNAALIPGVSCIENDSRSQNDATVGRKHVFASRSDAIAYAMVINTVNEAQRLFVRAYNSFLGDRTVGSGGGGNIGAPVNFEGLLKHDIPELADPKYHLVAWNSGDVSKETAVRMATDSSGRANLIPRMTGMKFRVSHDIRTVYRTDGRGNKYNSTTLGNLLYGKVTYGDKNKQNGPLYGETPQDVGWMVPDETAMQTLSVEKGGGLHTGVGVYVVENLSLRGFGTIPIAAKSKAYIVKNSGETGQTGGIPKFKATYWVKLAN